MSAMLDLEERGQRRPPTLTEEEKLYVASQWQLIWWKFRKHKLAMISIVVIALLYFLAIFADFLSPYTPTTRFPDYVDAPPHRLHLFDTSDGFKLRPFIYGFTKGRDPETFRTIYEEDETQKYHVRFFAKGVPYKFWGLFRAQRHLFQLEGSGDVEGGVTGEDAATVETTGDESEGEVPEGDVPIFLMGADRLGRDMFSRILYGARISLSIGLLGIALTFIFGLLLGGISGYFGGVVDSVVQRTIDLLRSIPTVPLWMGLAAALPQDWPPLRVYFGIVVILSVIGWTSLARVVRGKLLSLRSEDFVMAARLVGSSPMRIIIRHLLPSFASYIIVSLTLSIPNMILSETSLSFLGLGLRPPVVSWGVLLQESQHVRSVAHYPWRLIPVLFVIVTVLVFNFVGDGLRDAADPYGR
jgi:peptide/nickel transport system permease protein